MDLQRDAEKAKNTVEGNVERGAEHVKKAFDKPENDLKHDAKIESSKVKEDIKNKAADVKHEWNKDEDKERGM